MILSESFKNRMQKLAGLEENKKFSHKEYDNAKLTKSIYSILDETVLWSMATINTDAISHINTAYFCYDDNFNFYFLSETSTQHCKNIEKNKSMSVTVFNTEQQWGKAPLRGIQLFGECVKTNKFNDGHEKECYGKRFPAFTKWIDGLSKKEIQESKSVFYCFKPKKIKLLDEKSFGEETFIDIVL